MLLLFFDTLLSIYAVLASSNNLSAASNILECKALTVSQVTESAEGLLTYLIDMLLSR